MKVKTNQHIGALIESWSPSKFFLSSLLLIMFVGSLGLLSHFALLLYLPLMPLVYMGIADYRQKEHTILRNYPLLGRVRYFLESLRPEIRQYFVESDSEDVPFSREKRSVVFQRAKGEVDTLPFGTRRHVYETGYTWVNHSLAPVKVHKEASRVEVGGPLCTKPYSSSILNISGMSYGALSHNAISALNSGARLGGFAQNTGEGSISPFHLAHGGHLIWQIGTGYFGCRTDDGGFCPERFAERAQLESVKMIEVKLSQGAKPAHGGILPGAKVTAEIAEIRGVPVAKDVLSPPRHRAFDSPIGLLHFVQSLRDLSAGKPVGLKLCLGRHDQWLAVVKAMLETEITPDFITVDGGEGGTGAAPLEFSNSVGRPLEEALFFVHRSLLGAGLREQVRLFASGRVSTGFHMLNKFALGADGCLSARAMMFALGCIQALRCNTNRCPTGVATQDTRLGRGLVVKEKSARVYRFHEATVKSFLELLGATGASRPSEFRRDSMMRRVAQTEVRSFQELFPSPEPGFLVQGAVPAEFSEAWSLANSKYF